MLILASQSASRKAMLDAAGIAFKAIPALIDERAFEAALAGAAPPEVARALATEKALAVSSSVADRWVLGSDSLVVAGGRRFDKPGSRDEAADHLRFFSGRRMHLHSAATLVRAGAVGFACGDEAVLQVRTLSEAFIESYLAAEWPAVSGCVGVFRIEGRGVQLFDAVTGDHFTIMGMPLFQVLGGLRQVGVMPA